MLMTISGELFEILLLREIVKRFICHTNSPGNFKLVDNEKSRIDVIN